MLYSIQAAWLAHYGLVLVREEILPTQAKYFPCSEARRSSPVMQKQQNEQDQELTA